MGYTLNEFARLPKGKEAVYSRKLDALLATLDENVRATKKINKENDRLKKLNDQSMKRLRKSIEALGSY